MNLTYCEPNIKRVYDEDFTISPATDPTILGLRIESKKRVRFLPKNLSLVFPDLVLFIVSECAVSDVRKEHFKGLSKLRFLYLDYNIIDNVEIDAFVDLVSLQVLDLYKNKIISLHPKIFDPLLNLEILDLDMNRIYSLDENIFEKLINLTDVSIGFNKLETIPKNLFKHNSKLAKITLYKNKIKFIDPNMFNHLVYLECVKFEFDFCVNKLNYSAEFNLINENIKPVDGTVAELQMKRFLGLITAYV